MTTIYLPTPALRALHSRYVDYLLTLPDPIRDAFVGRMEGIGFDRFVLGLRSRRLAVTARIDGEQAFLGIAVPARGIDDWPLFELSGRHAGVDAQYLVTSAFLDFEDELADVLGGSK